MTRPAKEKPYPFADSVGAAVTEAKRRLGLSEKKLAERAKVSRRHLTEMQKGSNVTLRVAQKVMRALGITELALDDEERLSAPQPQEHAVALDAVTEQLALAVALLLNAAATVKNVLPAPSPAGSGARGDVADRTSRIIGEFADYLQTLNGEEKAKAVEQLLQAAVAPLKTAPGRPRKKRKKDRPGS